MENLTFCSDAAEETQLVTHTLPMRLLACIGAGLDHAIKKDSYATCNCAMPGMHLERRSMPYSGATS